MSSLSFKRPRGSLHRKAVFAALPLLVLIGLAGTIGGELLINGGHLYRGPLAEIGNYLGGARYHVNLSCPAQPRSRTLTLRASGFEDARGYLAGELPGCQLAEIRRIDQSWY